MYFPKACGRHKISSPELVLAVTGSYELKTGVNYNLLRAIGNQSLELLNSVVDAAVVSDVASEGKYKESVKSSGEGLVLNHIISQVGDDAVQEFVENFL